MSALSNRREFLDTKEVASLLGLTVSTLVFWRNLGEGPPWRKLGRRVMYPISELASWIEQQPASR